MAVTLNINDESMFGLTQPSYAFTLNLPNNYVSVRELIENRVRKEVEDYNEKQPEIFNMLVQPTHTERVLNGFKFKEKRKIDWREQYEKAVQAFERNSFIVLTDEIQMESLEQIIEVTPDTNITFLKLVPLVGG